MAPEESPITSVGAGLPTKSPVPSWPPLSPQHLMPPVESRAHVWYPPVLIPTTPLARPATLVGRRRLTFVLSPTWPNWFSPQHFVPTDKTAHVWFFPALIALTRIRFDERPATKIGASRLTTVLSPSCPKVLSPQHFISPAVRIAHVWWSPALMALAPLVRPVTLVGANRSVVSPVPSCP